MTGEVDEIERAFAEVGPWETRFVIDGRAYGGDREIQEDGRVPSFFEWVDEPTSILELGSFEGGHSAQLAAAPSVARVICLEGRAENVRRARTVMNVLGLSDRVQVEQVDLDTPDLSPFGTSDVAFCVGLLYHLVQPWLLLRELRQRVPLLFLETHISLTDHIRLAGYRGCMYRELGLEDTQSGLQSFSFWPTASDLERMVEDAGFRVVKRRDLPGVENRPRIHLLCEAASANG